LPATSSILPPLETLEQQIADLSDRLDAERMAPGGKGRAAMDRDLEIHRLTANLRFLRRFGLDVCLGRMVNTDNPEPVYIGRLGLTDSAGRRLLIDWRAPAAEPFFAATHANPMGLISRRRYRWTRGRISDRRGRGSGADRRRVADAAAPLPVAELHDRRRPCAGPARVHGVVAGTARADRVRRHQPGLTEHQLPDTRGGHGRSRASDPGGVPDASVPTSVRRSGVPIVHGPTSDLGSILDTWLAAHADGIACVIGDPTFKATSRVRSLTPETSKGLEFDLVVLVDPEAFGIGIEGTVDRYVGMTRATQQLVILTST
jgi:hypothetical protein